MPALKQRDSRRCKLSADMLLGLWLRSYQEWQQKIHQNPLSPIECAAWRSALLNLYTFFKQERDQGQHIALGQVQSRLAYAFWLCVRSMAPVWIPKFQIFLTTRSRTSAHAVWTPLLAQDKGNRSLVYSLKDLHTLTSLFAHACANSTDEHAWVFVRITSLIQHVWRHNTHFKTSSVLKLAREFMATIDGEQWALREAHARQWEDAHWTNDQTEIFDDDNSVFGDFQDDRDEDFDWVAHQNDASVPAYNSVYFCNCLVYLPTKKIKIFNRHN